MMRYKWFIVAFISLNIIFCASPQKKIEQARKKDPRYQYNMGLFYLNNGNLDQAIIYLNRSVTLNPNYYLAFNALGLTYSMKGDFQESINQYQKCLLINPTFSEARNNLGAVYQEMGMLDKAEQEFRIALADKNYNSRELPYYNLARLYMAQEKLTEALEYVQNALEINKDMAMAYNLKGLIHEKLENFEAAIEGYNQAVKIVPQDVNFNFNLAVAYFKNNQFDMAKETFEKISTKTTDPEMERKINQYLKIIKKE